MDHSLNRMFVWNYIGTLLWMNVLIVLIKLQLNNLFLQLKLLRWMVFGKDTFNIKLSIGITSYAQSVGKCYSNGLSVGVSRVHR